MADWTLAIVSSDRGIRITPKINTAHASFIFWRYETPVSEDTNITVQTDNNEPWQRTAHFFRYLNAYMYSANIDGVTHILPVSGRTICISHDRDVGHLTVCVIGPNMMLDKSQSVLDYPHDNASVSRLNAVPQAGTYDITNV
jgi:hypothetical protein